MADRVGRAARGPALPRTGLRAIIPHLLFRIRRERCAGCRPLNTISTGAQTRGGNALSSAGCETCGGRVSRRSRKRKSCCSRPRRRRAPTKKLARGVPKRLDPHHSDPSCARLRASPPDRLLSPTRHAPGIDAAILDGRSRRGSGWPRCWGTGRWLGRSSGASGGSDGGDQTGLGAVRDEAAWAIEDLAF
jgi:hypothetical protein